MRYKSRPHSIRAFKFAQGLEVFPEWFDTAMQEGKAMFTINNKNKYVTMFDPKGGQRRAYYGDWVCMNDSGTLFPLDDEEFERGFEAE